MFMINRALWSREQHKSLLIRKARAGAELGRHWSDAAQSVAIRRHVQQAANRDTPSVGQFRATHVALRDADEWLVAGIQMSPIPAPPRAS